MTENSSDDDSPTAGQINDSSEADQRVKTTKPQYLFPRRTLADALRVPMAIRTHNGGEPYDPQEIARALNVGGKTGSYFYLTTASRDYGFTEGTRDSSTISLTVLGRKAVYPESDDQKKEAELEAFLSVEVFRGVVEHYKGSKLPGDEFVRNTLEVKFGLDPRTHDEFLTLFDKNCRLLGIGADWDPHTQPAQATKSRAATPASGPGRGGEGPPTRRDPGERPVCFVAMPFTEKTDQFAPGFFSEVYSSLFKPAIEAAGFEATTARNQGSDVIQSTIVNGLLNADLVLVDLTEHNPNVLFELGLRIAERRPTLLVKAVGTNPIFDVDNLMRVVSYNPNLWPSTVESDLPKLTEFISGAWECRDSERSYMDILRQETPVGH